MKLKPIFVFLGIFAAYALSGYLFPEGGDWYEGLSKPAGVPSQSVIGIVWLVLNVLIALSFAIISVKRLRDGRIDLLFATNWVLHQGYTILFLGQHRLFASAMDATLLALSTVALVFYVFTKHRTAGRLLIPYLVWTLYIAYLSWGIYVLN